MAESILPNVLTPKEVADYLRINQDTVTEELNNGNLTGFKIVNEWRITEEDLLSYMRKGISKPALTPQSLVTKAKTNSDWHIVQVQPFTFNWPKQGGGSIQEYYDEAYEATRTIGEQEYTFKIGFGNRPTAGQARRRVTIWLGNRAIVEFAGSNNYEKDGLLAGVIRLKNGKQLSTQRIPEEYKPFKLEKYNSVVSGPRASTNMAVIVQKEDLKTMLEHAVIRATWKELL